MSFKRKLFYAATIALAIGAGPALSYDHPEDGLVVFINASSNTVTVSVDDATVCTIEPDETCSTVLSGSDADAEHRVHGDMGSGRTWDDKVQISECHWNWNGTKTYTFTDQNVPFECKQ